MSKDKWDKEDSRFKVESADAGKVWIVSKSSGTAYQVSLKTYEKNKNSYIKAPAEAQARAMASAYSKYKKYRKDGGVNDFDAKKWINK